VVYHEASVKRATVTLSGKLNGKPFKICRSAPRGACCDTCMCADHDLAFLRNMHVLRLYLNRLYDGVALMEERYTQKTGTM
jgi:hypothetical protein